MLLPDNIEDIRRERAARYVAYCQEIGRSVGLFQSGEFVLHAGTSSGFKIDCDALTDADLAALAKMAAAFLPDFSSVVGIPRGGVRMAAALESYVVEPFQLIDDQGRINIQRDGPRLLVDDVMTSGSSMAEFYRPGDIGLVIFSRMAAPYPTWITAIFELALFRGECDSD